jgi:hypothetical protein
MNKLSLIVLSVFTVLPAFAQGPGGPMSDSITMQAGESISVRPGVPTQVYCQPGVAAKPACTIVVNSTFSTLYDVVIGDNRVSLEMSFDDAMTRIKTLQAAGLCQ